MILLSLKKKNGKDSKRKFLKNVGLKIMILLTLLMKLVILDVYAMSTPSSIENYLT